MRSQHLCQRNGKFLCKRLPEGAGHPLPRLCPCAGSKQAGAALCSCRGSTGVEQKQMCVRCSGREALAEAQNAALGTGSWKSVFLDRLLLVSRSNTVYFEVLGVQCQALSLPWLGGSSTAGVAPARGGQRHGGGCASARAHRVCPGTGSSQSSLTCMAGFWGLEAGHS